ELPEVLDVDRADLGAAVGRVCGEAVVDEPLHGLAHRAAAHPELARQPGDAQRGARWKPVGQDGRLDRLVGALSKLPALLQTVECVWDRHGLTSIISTGRREDIAWSAAPAAAAQHEPDVEHAILYRGFATTQVRQHRHGSATHLVEWIPRAGQRWPRMSARRGGSETHYGEVVGHTDPELLGDGQHVHRQAVCGGHDRLRPPGAGEPIADLRS